MLFEMTIQLGGYIFNELKFCPKVCTQKNYYFNRPTTLEPPNPFKMLEIYHEWTSNVCNELIQSPTLNANAIATCIHTEKMLKDLMEKLVGAGDIALIKEVADVPLEKLMKLYELSSKEHGPSSSLFLIPDRHFKYGLRRPLDIMRMGKFVKSFQIPMHSREYNYKYDGKYFVFERCIIFANLLHGGESFSYENHFWIKDLKFVESNGKKCARLTSNTHNISVDNDDFVKILKYLQQKFDYESFVSAEISMTEWELNDFTKTSTRVANYRRHSFYVSRGNVKSLEERMSKFENKSNC